MNGGSRSIFAPRNRHGGRQSPRKDNILSSDAGDVDGMDCVVLDRTPGYVPLLGAPDREFNDHMTACGLDKHGSSRSGGDQVEDGWPCKSEQSRSQI